MFDGLIRVYLKLSCSPSSCNELILIQNIKIQRIDFDTNEESLVSVEKKTLSAAENSSHFGRQSTFFNVFFDGYFLRCCFFVVWNSLEFQNTVMASLIQRVFIGISKDYNFLLSIFWFIWPSHCSNNRNPTEFIFPWHCVPYEAQTNHNLPEFIW